jgi:hypothetical protein
VGQLGPEGEHLEPVRAGPGRTSTEWCIADLRMPYSKDGRSDCACFAMFSVTTTSIPLNGNGGGDSEATHDQICREFEGGDPAC